MLHNKQDLDFARVKANAGEAPWEDLFAELASSPAASLRRTPQPVKTIVVGFFNAMASK